jgi:hypothetical protein
MWDCPKCHRRAFGVLSIYGNTYMRRCNDCDHDQRFDLPLLNKKIIYLDQVAISLLVKVEHGRAPEKWRQVRDAIERARRVEAIVMPYSEFHERESVADKTFAESLKKLYQHLSMGVSYHLTNRVQQNQIYDALRRFVKELLRETDPWRHVLDQNPNVWSEDCFITMNMPDVTNQASRFQAVKKQIEAEVKNLNATYKNSKATFDEQYVMEERQAGCNIWELYRQDQNLFQTATTAEEMANVMLYGSSFADTGKLIFDFFKERGYNGEALDRKFVEFLGSPEFKAIDHVRISSAMFSGLMMRVQGGRGLVQTNDFIDISAIEYYAPYCDAMFIDNSMCHLITTNPVRDRLALKTKFFCAKTIDSFISYLQQLEKDAPTDVRDAVEVLHGPII